MQQLITSKLTTNILPSALGLYDIHTEERDGKIIINITVASGPQKPYYISQYGMSPNGYYIRSGSASMPMTVSISTHESILKFSQKS
jgi:predicted HTH transcriptional regulator